MNLSDKTIRALIESGEMKFIPPLDKDQIQCGSVDLRLGNQVSIMMPGDDPLDTRVKPKDTVYATYEITEDKGLEIRPWQFLLATTRDYMKLPDDVGGSISGRSSIGRLGLFVENAGWVDPGFEGEITLELYNASPRTIIIYPGMRIAQIELVRMDQMPDKPYRGKYQGQKGATVSRVYLDSEQAGIERVIG